MRIGVDVDGVLRDFVGAMHDIYTVVYPDRRVVLPVTDYLLWKKHFPFNTEREFHKFYNDEYPQIVFTQAEQTYATAVDELNDCIHADQIEIVSIQKRRNIPYSLQWLADQKCNIKRVRFAQNFDDKLEGLDAIVDDHYHVLKEAHNRGIKTIRFIQSYNGMAQQWSDHSITTLGQLNDIGF